MESIHQTRRMIPSVLCCALAAAIIAVGMSSRALNEAEAGLKKLGSNQRLVAPPGSLLAVADLHGDLSKAKQALQLLSVISQDGSWVAQGITVVQLGDLVDRGPSSLELLTFMHGLQDQATQHDSRLVLLIGNHGIINLQGDFRYVAPEELMRLGHHRHSSHEPAATAAIGPDMSPAYSSGLQQWAKLWQVPAVAAGAAAAAGNAEGSVRARVAERHQLLAVEGRGGPCATAFIHAGLTPRILHSLLDAIVGEPAAQQRQQQQQLGVVTAEELARINAVAQQALARCDRQHCADGTEGALVQRMWSLLTNGQGPVWVRHQALGGDAAGVCDHLQQVLARLGVHRLVVGHTPQEGGRARLKCGGRLLLLDTGMSSGMMDSAAAAWVCPPAALQQPGQQQEGQQQQAGHAEVVYADGMHHAA